MNSRIPSWRIASLCVGTTVLMLALVSVARASDLVGVYATISAVDFEPEGESTDAERVRIRGVFSLATGRREYLEPTQGYLYCSLVKGQEEVCRREWRDLKTLAGTGKLLAFGSRHGLDGVKVRELGRKPAKPTPFSLSSGGVREVRRDSGYFVIRDQNAFARPLTPLGGVALPPGKVTLEAERMRGREHAEAKYVFWIEGPDGKKRSSPPIAPGEKDVTWKPPIEVQAGARYSWGLRAVDGEWKGPGAKARFRGMRSTPERKEKTPPEKKAVPARRSGKDSRS